jgi:hypothetical protein
VKVVVFKPAGILRRYFLMFMKIEKDGVPWNLSRRWLP